MDRLVNSITGSNAELRPLGAVATVRAGYGFRSAIQASPQGTVIAAQLRDVHRGKLNWKDAIRTSLPRDPKKEELLRSGDILFSFRGTRYLAVAIEAVPGSAVASTQFMLVRVSDPGALLPDFLAWQLNQPPAQRYFKSKATGTAQLSLRRGDIESVLVAIPSMDLQKKVVELVELVRLERQHLERLLHNREQQLNEIAASLFDNSERDAEA
jgi:hypothetical protein